MTQSLTPPNRVADVQLLPVWRADASPDGQKAGGQNALKKIETAQDAPQPGDPAKVRVNIDGLSGRFVQTLLDPLTEEVLLQYPNNNELAFSRAIAAYVRAQRR